VTQPYVRGWYPQPLFAGWGELADIWLDK